MVDVPALTPVTIPVVPTVAFALLLLQAPLPVPVSGMVLPWHTDELPVIAATAELTVTGLVTVQPEPSE